MQKYTCPCCGYKSLAEKTEFPTYEICEICFWEFDGYPDKFPQMIDKPWGPNHVSLKEGQQNFLKFGANEQKALSHVRKPTKADVKDPKWKPLK